MLTCVGVSGLVTREVIISLQLIVFVLGNSYFRQILQLRNSSKFQLQNDDLNVKLSEVKQGKLQMLESCIYIAGVLFHAHIQNVELTSSEMLDSVQFQITFYIQLYAYAQHS